MQPGARNSGNAMTGQLKLHIKYARRLGVHVSPTVFVNGIEAAHVSSGWTPQQWADLIAEQLA
jgi:protein-disulfide isomerase